MSYTVSPVKPGSSVGKRSHHSGDDDCGDGKELTHSAKKKFKRVRLLLKMVVRLLIFKPD